MDDARHASGHGTSRSGGEIVEGLQRRSKAFEGVRKGSKRLGGVQRRSKAFEGAPVSSKGFGALRRGVGIFAGVRGGSWTAVEGNGGVP